LHGDKAYKVLFVETPHKFITAKLSIRKPGSSSVLTDEDPGLRIENFAVINLRGVSTNKNYYNFVMFANQINITWR
jgi:hypothetical protein